MADGGKAALDRSEAEVEVGEDVADRLETHGEANHARVHTRCKLLCFGQLAVSRRCRVDDEAAHVTDVRDVAVQLQSLGELLTRIAAALHVERDDRTKAATLEVLLRALVPRARRESRPRHAFDLRVLGQVLGDLCRIRPVTLHATLERGEELRNISVA